MLFAVGDDVRGDVRSSVLKVRLAAEPVSVSGARRFVADGLASWGMTELVENATVCVSELATNAALHSESTFMEVAMRPLEGGVQINVEDDGITPAEAVAPREMFPEAGDEGVLPLDDEPTTGRGLAIVSILAREWGVERTARGKRVWCHITDGDEEYDVRPPLSEGVLELPPDPDDSGMPAGWTMVKLARCPVWLSLRQDEHLDELVRELQLIEGGVSNPRSRELAQQLQGLLSAPAHARHTGRRIAQQAAANGLEYIDIEMAMPHEFSAEVQKLDVAVKAADVLCEEMQLLTLASSPELRQLRAWMTAELTNQIEHGAAPVPWDEWLAQQPPTD
jgi:anti-sigma regulatory factor (Ser/Thr protein kinase)